MEVLNMMKSCFAFAFLQFARFNLKFAQKFKMNCKFQIDFTRSGKTLQ